MTRPTGEEEREMGEEPNRVRERRRERAGLSKQEENEEEKRKEGLLSGF